MFNKAVKKLYPSEYIRHIDHNDSVIYNIKDIKTLFNQDFNYELVKFYNYKNPYQFTIDYYIKESDIIHAMKNTDNIKMKNVLKEMYPVVLTRDVLKKQVENIFDEFFVYDLYITKDYHLTMYMLKYNLAFEFPGSYMDPQLRQSLTDKTGLKSIQLHDESTFGGDIVAANSDFCNAISVAYKHMNK